jgi:threonine-phosphate decarboxylase
MSNSRQKIKTQKRIANPKKAGSPATMKLTRKLARNTIKNLKPCKHGGRVWEAGKKTKQPIEEIVDFSSSVNPLGASPKALEVVKNSSQQIQMYPDSNSESLREAVASSFSGISKENVVVGNGSTELIYLFAETFLDKGQVALIPAPTFGEYENAVKKAGGQPKHIKLSSSLYVEANSFADQMKGAKIAFLCNPNNPTSILTPYDTVIEIVEEALKNEVLVFLDEDFLEFVDETKQVSLINKVNDYPNLFVLRSFTKGFGLTGLRVGYGVACKDTIDLLFKAKIPWNVNCLGQVAAVAALEDKEHMQKSLKIVRAEKALLVRELSNLEGFKLYPSDANFILIDIRGSGFTSAKLAEMMLAHGVLIRDCSSFAGLDDFHVRVAVKTRKENQKLLNSFTKVLQNNPTEIDQKCLL